MQYTNKQKYREYAAVGVTQECIDHLADTVCLIIKEPEKQSVIRWRILGTVKNAIAHATACKKKAQSVIIYQRSLTALSVGVASVASAVGSDPNQTKALLFGVVLTLLIQIGKEIELVNMPVVQWVELRDMIENIVGEINGFIVKDSDYCDLSPEKRWVCLTSRCQAYISNSSKTINNNWAITFGGDTVNPKIKNDYSGDVKA